MKSLALAALLLIAAATAQTPDWIAQLPESGNEAFSVLESHGATAILPLAEAMASADAATASTAEHALNLLVHRGASLDARYAAAKELAQLLDDTWPDEVRRNALRWLGLVGDEDCAELIAPLLKNEALALEAVMALEQIATKNSTDLLVNALKDASPTVRARIIYTLGQRGDDGLGGVLMAQRHDANRAILWALIDVAAKHAVTPTQIAPWTLAQGRFELLQYIDGAFTAAEAALARGDVEAARSIYEHAVIDWNQPYLTAAALRGMSVTNSERLAAIAFGYLSETGLRREVWQVLATAPDTQLNTTMATAFDAAPSYLKADIIRLLHERGAPELGSVLKKVGEDSPAEIRFAAAEIKDTVDADLLRETLRTGAYFSRLTAGDAAIGLAREAVAANDEAAALQLIHMLFSTPVANAQVADAIAILAVVQSVDAKNLLTQLHGYADPRGAPPEDPKETYLRTLVQRSEVVQAALRDALDVTATAHPRPNTVLDAEGVAQPLSIASSLAGLWLRPADNTELRGLFDNFRSRIQANSGGINGVGGEYYLWLTLDDLSADEVAALPSLLSTYSDILTAFRPDDIARGPLTVILVSPPDASQFLGPLRYWGVTGKGISVSPYLSPVIHVSLDALESAVPEARNAGVKTLVFAPRELGAEDVVDFTSQDADFFVLTYDQLWTNKGQAS